MPLQLHAVELGALLSDQQPLPLAKTDPTFRCKVQVPVRASLGLAVRTGVAVQREDGAQALDG